MNTQDTLKVTMLQFTASVHLGRVFFCFKLTPELGFHGNTCITNKHSWTMAEVYLAAHKASKHLCVCRSKDNTKTILWESGREIKAELKVVLKKVKRGQREENIGQNTK